MKIYVRRFYIEIDIFFICQSLRKKRFIYRFLVSNEFFKFE